MTKWSEIRHNENGEEILNDTPMQPPLGYRRAPSLAEQIRAQVIAAKLEELDQLEETEDDADDFEVGDDYEPLSSYENDHIPSIKELRRQVSEINAEIHKRNHEALREQVNNNNESKRIEPAAASAAAVPPAEQNQA